MNIGTLISAFEPGWVMFYQFSQPGKKLFFKVE